MLQVTSLLNVVVIVATARLAWRLTEALVGSTLDPRSSVHRRLQVFFVITVGTLLLQACARPLCRPVPTSESSIALKKWHGYLRASA